MSRGEALAELALFEVGDGIFAEGNVLREEVVEVVVHEGVVDAARVAKDGEDDETDEEAAEAATGLFGWRWRWCCRRCSLAGCCRACFALRSGSDRACGHASDRVLLGVCSLQFQLVPTCFAIRTANLLEAAAVSAGAAIGASQPVGGHVRGSDCFEQCPFATS